MKKTGKLFYIFAFMIIGVICIAFPLSAQAQTEEQASLISQNDRIMFADLFFNNKDDINKIMKHFDEEISNGELPKTGNIEVFNLIEDLQLNTTYDETVCILKELNYIDNFVETDEINKVITGRSFSDPIGGMLTNSIEENLGLVQPLWNKDSVHKNKTTELAKKYFSDSVATKIGEYDREVDIKYSSVGGYVLGLEQQYIHFNQYASGSDDSRDYAAATWFVSSELAWNKGQKENAYMYLGYALHPLQDKESHGQIDRGKKRPAHIGNINGDNRGHADDPTGWEWTNSNKNALKAVSGSKVRYNAAVKVTDKYLKQYAGIFK